MQQSLVFPPVSPRTAPPPLSAEVELYWLALVLCPGLGPQRGAELLARFGDVRSIFSATRADLEACSLSGTLAQTIVSGCTFDEAVEQQEKARALGVHILPREHPCFPARLRGIEASPLLLFARGNLHLLEAVIVAVVGTRRPTTYGKSVATKMSKDLAGLGCVISSGMARGIDTYAHRAALDAGGTTIAVFGSGVDVIYPTENKGLAEEIAAKGLLLTEYPIGTPSYPQNFPQRNRIVSGISHGVLVVEGAQYSGSAITARLALEQQRDVFAVPGNITSRMSWGPNLLIRQGATLVQDASDILHEISSDARTCLYRGLSSPAAASPPRQETALEASPPLDEGSRRVFAALRVDEGKYLDLLLEELPGMSSSEIIAALFQLEMLGLTKQDAGQRYTKVWC